jgi:Zn finger protein HypA/HybF involved in hydrogenase expression
MNLRQQEVKFHCNFCKTVLPYKSSYSCPRCGKYIGWEFVNKIYKDEYLEIYEVGA